MNQQKNYDIAIIGAGPVGIECAVRLQRAGLDVVVIEKGGIAQTIYNYPKNMRFVRTKQEMQIEDIEYRAKTDYPTKEEALTYYHKVVEQEDLEVCTFCELELFTKKIEGGYILYVQDSRTKQKNKNIDKINANMVVMAIGACQKLKPFVVEDYTTKQVIVREFEDGLPYRGKKCVVVGGGNSGVDTALDLVKAGAKVRLLIRESEYRNNVPAHKIEELEIYENHNNIWIEFDTAVKAVFDDFVVLNDDGYIFTDFVFPMIGYQINWEFLSSIGIQSGYDLVQAKFVTQCDAHTRESDMDNVFIAGAVTGSLDGGIPKFKKGIERLVETILVRRGVEPDSDLQERMPIDGESSVWMVKVKNDAIKV